MGAARIDVCVVDRDAEREGLLQLLLREGFSVTETQPGAQVLEHVRRHHPRVVIAPLHAPELDAVELCRQVRGDPSLDDTFLIVLSSSPAREIRPQILNAGADEILARPFDLDELLARLRNGLRISHLHERLRTAALTDGLTGLWNHVHFRDLLDREFARTRRYGGEVAMIMLDLDHFKAVNDTYGHEVGNRVLQATAHHLERTVRDTDIVARYGGEEFAVICPHTTLPEAESLAERIRAHLPEEVRMAECPQMHVTATLGVISSTEPGVSTVADLINLADQALYTGKAQGRNCVARCDQAAPALNGGVQVGEVERLRKQVLSLSLQAKELCLQSVWSLVQALEARDPYTVCQSRDVRFYVERLVEAAGWPEALSIAAANAAMLHNLGKIGIPDRILQKPGPLDPDEAAALRQVPLLTSKILEPLRVFETEILIIRHLREWYDGSGYPFGLGGRSIPLGARMLAIAEAFNAMTSDRAYRPRGTIDEALTEIQRQAGRQFDPDFADLIVRVVEEQRDVWQERINQALAAAARMTSVVAA